MKIFPSHIGISVVSLLLLAACHHTKDDGAPIAATSYTLSDIPPYIGDRKDSAEDALTVEGVALGKALFMDSSLSSDGRVSCKSCHQPQLAFSDPRPVSLGVNGRAGTRQSMALVNLAWDTHFFWDGRAHSVEEQVGQPMTNPVEMNLTPPQIDQKLQTAQYRDLFGRAFSGQQPTFALARKALSMFVRTLVSGKSKYDLYLQNKYTPTSDELAGMTLFFIHPSYPTRGGNCGDCHRPFSLAGETVEMRAFKNNGLAFSTTAPDFGLQTITGSAADKGKFKIPSLRNIALTAPYMHDGRFATLEQVLDHYNSDTIMQMDNVDGNIATTSNDRVAPGGAPYHLGLTNDEKRQIIVFLHMLTDTTYLKL